MFFYACFLYWINKKPATKKSVAEDIKSTDSADRIVSVNDHVISSSFWLISEHLFQ